MLIPSIKAISILDLNVEIDGNDISVDYFVYEGREFNYTYSTSGNYEILIYNDQRTLIFDNYYSTGRLMDGNESLITKKIISDKIPYNKKMSSLEIKENNQIIKSINLNFCNNNTICEENENSLTCSDCKPDKPDNLCVNAEDGICDPDCLEGYDPDCENDSAENNTGTPQGSTKKIDWINILLVFLVIAAVILAAWVIFYVKNQKKK